MRGDVGGQHCLVHGQLGDEIGVARGELTGLMVIIEDDLVCDVLECTCKLTVVLGETTPASSVLLGPEKSLTKAVKCSG